VETGFGADTAVAKEYQLKAAFLYNFTKFVEWPADAFAETNSPIRIGVLSSSPLNVELVRAVEGRKINGRQVVVVVKAIENVADAEGLEVLFIPAAADRQFAERFGALKTKPVLTVGETEFFGRQGGMIQFTQEADKLRFEINMGAAAAAQLKISAQLQKLAKSVRKNNPT
jgi:hypothetical protein